MLSLSPESELTLLIGLAKPLALEPERYEEFFEILAPVASQNVMNSMSALRERFSRAFAAPAPTRAEKERRLRGISDDMMSAGDVDTRLAGVTLRDMVNRFYKKA